MLEHRVEVELMPVPQGFREQESPRRIETMTRDFFENIMDYSATRYRARILDFRVDSATLTYEGQKTGDGITTLTYRGVAVANVTKIKDAYNYVDVRFFRNLELFEGGRSNN